MLSCQSSSLPSPESVCVCDKGVRNQPPLISDRGTQLPDRMVGGPQQMKEMIPTQAGHAVLYGYTYAGCKAAPTHASPRTPHELDPSQSSLCQMFGAAGSQTKGGKQNAWGWP